MVQHAKLFELLEGDSTLKGQFFEEIGLLTRKSKVFKNQFDLKYQEWKDQLKHLYVAEYLDDNLFLLQGFLILISNLLLKKNVGSTLDDPYLVESSSFIDTFSWLKEVKKTRKKVELELDAIIYEECDFFNKIYQKILPHSTKHGSGEYYTPEDLAKLMIDDVYVPGQVILDPACGSGIFIVATIKKIARRGLNKSEKARAISRIITISVLLLEYLKIYIITSNLRQP
jgi:type I restriction-modification system DNA methylase subunit